MTQKASTLSDKKSCRQRRCQVRMGVAFAAGVLVSTSMASWASFQYVGRPLNTPSAGSAASSMYLPGPGAAPEKPDLQGFTPAFTHIPALVEKGAGIAWPCHGAGQGTLGKVLYRLLPPGWSLYVKPGTLLDVPTWYACHSSPWTVPLRQVLHRENYTGTLWWGYNVLSIAPRVPAAQAPDPAAGVPATKPAPVIQPGGPMLPIPPHSDIQTTLPLPTTATVAEAVADPHPAIPVHDPVAARSGHGVSVSTQPAAPDAPLTLGPGGVVVSAGWHQHVIPLQKAVREGWQLAISKHPDAKQLQLARAWLSNGGALYYPLSDMEKK